jgi:hypothetical protein
LAHRGWRHGGARLRFFERCTTGRTLGTLVAFWALTTRFAWLAWFTRLTWLTGLVLGLIVRGRVIRAKSVLSCRALLGMICSAVFTRCTVATLTAVTAIAVA